MGLNAHFFFIFNYFNIGSGYNDTLNHGKISIIWKTYGETHTPYDVTEAPMVKQYVFPYRFRPCAPSKYTILDTIRIEDFFFDYIELFWNIGLVLEPGIFSFWR